MANITAALVKELRERTQAGMMDCKKALMENDGDMDKAIDWLREKGLAQAAKKAGRIAAEGAVVQYITECGKVGAVVEVNCETDFVAKTDNFMNFANSVAKHVALANPADIEALNAQKFVDDETKTIEDLISEATVAIGEKISVRRFARYETTGLVSSYIHMGGKVGVLLQVETGKAETAAAEAFQTMCKDITLHIAACAPKSVDSSSLDPAFVAEEQEIAKAQLIAEGKPEHLLEKILPGKLKALYKQSCLMSQEFVKDPSISVEKLVANIGKELGDTVTVVSFERFQLGA